MTTNNIILVSYGHFEKDFLAILADSVMQEYNVPVKMEESHIDLSEFYDPTRRQYDGNRLLNEVDSKFSSETTRTIGLFRVDLFIPILTYIFGQAALSGKTGIASLYRLKNELYGVKHDEDLLLERFKKVIIHEIGHTQGLKHCHTPDCVMISSTYAEDIDQKSTRLCIKCRTEIGLI